MNHTQGCRLTSPPWAAGGGPPPGACAKVREHPARLPDHPRPLVSGNNALGVETLARPQLDPIQ